MTCLNINPMAEPVMKMMMPMYGIALVTIAKRALAISTSSAVNDRVCARCVVPSGKGVGLLSSTQAPFRLRLTAAQTGIDPRTHYWFKVGPGDYRGGKLGPFRVYGPAVTRKSALRWEKKTIGLLRKRNGKRSLKNRT